MMRIDSNLANKPKPTLVVWSHMHHTSPSGLNADRLLVDSSSFNINLRLLFLLRLIRI